MSKTNGHGRGDGDGNGEAAKANILDGGVIEYPEGSAFPGSIGIDARESVEAWPAPLRARPGAPNVLYIVLDDVGFGQLGCYGGPIETPNIDRIADKGLRYTNFHTTALCSPTRSCLLTGRNHHSNGMAGITEVSSGFPGYNGQIPKANGFLSEMLVPEGYATFAIGKWHLTPDEECNVAARKDRWPLGRGFERFYGFLGGETNQWQPDLVHDNHPIEPPATAEEGYHLTADLTDQAIRFVTDLHNIAPDKPFLMYFCTGAAHAPHHAPRAWSDHYRGRFDAGWEAVRNETFSRQKQRGIVPPGTELPPRPDYIQAWDSLDAEERRLFARQMEVFAGFLSHADDQIGRLLDFLESVGRLENTLIVLVSDNGASAEGGPTGSINENRFFNLIPDSTEDNLAKLDELGGPTTYNHYAFGWTWCGNTPLKKWKREVHEGGITDPMIVSWPARIRARGELRHQYVHAIDVVPTILQAFGLEAPRELAGVAQRPIEGTSFAYTFADAEAPSRHSVQYYEMLGCRAIYRDGWKAVTYHAFSGAVYDGKSDPSLPFSDDVWELYHVEEDFSEMRDLAAAFPEKLRELQDLWWVEAGKYNVLPLDARGPERLMARKPQLTRERRQYVYIPGAPVPEAVAVDVKNRSHVITADVIVPPSGGEGVLLAHGGRFGGYSFFMKDGHMRYVYNFCDIERYVLDSPMIVTPGRHSLTFEFRRRGEMDVERGLGAGGLGRFYVDGKSAGEGHIPRTLIARFALSGEGLCCGYDCGSTVTADYESPFRFSGRVLRVMVDVSGDRFVSPELEGHIAMARQ